MLLTYTIRNLWARRRTALPMILSIAGAVMGAVLVRANMESLFSSVLNQAERETAVVIAKDAVSEDRSSIPMTLLARLQVSPGIAQVEAAAAISPELLSATMVRAPDGAPSFVTLRGVDPIAYVVHPRVRLISGRKPARDEPGVVVGAQLLGRYQGIAIDGELAIGRRRFRVLGVFDAAGTAYESEIWVDRSAMMQELRRDDVSVIVAKLQPSPDALAALQHTVAQIRERPLSAVGAAEFMQRSLVQFMEYRATTSIVTFLLFLGSLFACTSAMYTSVLGRRRELATLLAIGFTRGRVGLLLLIESSLLAMSGGIVGILLTLSFHGRSVSYSDTRTYALLLDRSLLGGGVMMAVAIGLIGGAVALTQSRRLDILQSLRS